MSLEAELSLHDKTSDSFQKLTWLSYSEGSNIEQGVASIHTWQVNYIRPLTPSQYRWYLSAADTFWFRVLLLQSDHQNLATAFLSL